MTITINPPDNIIDKIQTKAGLYGVENMIE